jgi:hypothetical protein
MNNDIVLYQLAVEHQKELLLEIKNERIARQSTAGKPAVSNISVFRGPGYLFARIMNLNRRNRKDYRHISS